jgi:hypothetical protein
VKVEQFCEGVVRFHCPGCNRPHGVGVAPGKHGLYVWGYNGNPAAPTFTPSIYVKTGHHAGGPMRPDGKCNLCESAAERGHRSPCAVCHSFVTDGRIQFLSDCTHVLAGQTVELPDWPEDEP